MNKILNIVWFTFIVSNLVVIGAAYSKDDVMGDPSDSLSEINPQVKWVTGAAKGGYIIAAVLGIFAGAIYFYMGSIVGSSDSKGKGISGIIGSVGITILVTVSMTLLFALVDKF